MKKILAILEAYVQIATLAVGAAFLGFMVWTYIIQNPATKSVNYGGSAQTVTPGTIDPVVRDGPAATLKTKMDQPGTIAIDAPQIPTLPLHPPATQPAVNFAAYSWQQDIPKIHTSPDNGPRNALVLKLPDLPPLQYLDQENLRTVLQVTPPGAAAPIKQDQDSVTTFWSLPVGALASAYQSSFVGKVGPEDQKVIFAHADLIREKQQPDGSWGPDVVVNQVFTVVPPPYPNPSAPDFKAAAATYSAWLLGNQKSIGASDFPPVYYSAQDRPDLQWKPLDQINGRTAQPAVGQPNPGAPANPAPAPAGVNAFLPPAQPAAPPPAKPAAGGANGGLAGGAAGTAVGQAVKQVIDAQNPQPAAPPGLAPLAPAVSLPPLQPLPDAAFVATQVAKGPGDIEVWFHDLTVEPGATYRYKVRYGLKNPVFDKPNAVKTPADAMKFTIDSPDSQWSADVVVPARTRFWCSTKNPGGKARSTQQVDFKVFVWHDGKWNEKDFNAVSTGDEIGDGDFVTHVTLLGAVSRQGTGIEQPRQVLLVPDTGGPAELRNERSDATSPELQTFLKNVAAQAPASDTPAAAAPVGPAAAPGIAGPGVKPNIMDIESRP
jgi:hypothetical protein